MLEDPIYVLDQFLDQIHLIETKVARLITKSNLSEPEKQFILDHILIVPSKSQQKEKV